MSDDVSRCDSVNAVYSIYLSWCEISALYMDILQKSSLSVGGIIFHLQAISYSQNTHKYPYFIAA